MTTQTVKIPDSKKSAFNSFVREIGGEIVIDKKSTATEKSEDDDEVTHGVFFGENIKRVIKAFKKD